jgi:hypothetical protein
MKYCSKCKLDKDVADFPKKSNQPDGLSRWCRQCKSEADRALYLRNRERRKKQAASYYENNRAEILSARSANKELNAKKLKEWQLKNKEHIRAYANQYSKRKLKEDPIYLLKRRLRNRLGDILRNRGWKKSSSLTESIGCTYEVLKSHIESLFKLGMSWDNYGEWEIDHSIPLASAKTPEEILKLNHYTNLQPMWAKENRIKGSKT